MTRDPWEIPKTWCWVEIGNVAGVVGGGTPRTADPANFEDGEIAWITPADLSGYTSKYISHGARNITRRGLETSGARLMPAGTVLFSSRAPIGYVAIAANAVSTNQGFKSFVLPLELLPDYVYYYLKRARDLAVTLSSGTTFQEISGAKAALIPIPITGFSEQRRIVAEIEKQFTRLDAAVEALRRVKANLKRYRASVLKAACEGRLVSTEAELARRDGRSYEPASELLKRILTERRARWEADQLAKFRASPKIPKDDKWKSKYKEPNEPDTASLSELPEGWAWATTGQVCEIQGGIQKQPSRRPIKNVFPFLRVANVFRGRLDLSEVHRIEVFPGELDKLCLKPRDLLIVEGNGSPTEIGRMAIWKGEIENCVHQNHIIRARPVPGITPQLISLFWNSPDGMAAVLSVAGSTSGLYTLSVSKVSKLTVPLPPLPEQERIVAEVDRCFSVIEGLEAVVEANLKRAHRLRQAILKHAFEGKLVPQDPDEEPASVLLERIKAVRSTDNAVRSE